MKKQRTLDKTLTFQNPNLEETVEVHPIRLIFLFKE